MARLVALQARLRGKDGCPWDREQTHESLRTYLVEETYEVLEALESGEAAKIADELGDLLLQIVFHAQLGREAGRFDMAEVIERVHSNLLRRHPHVFGGAKAETAAQVLKNWEQLKREERQAAAEGFFGPAKGAGPQNDRGGEAGARRGKEEGFFGPAKGAGPQNDSRSKGEQKEGSVLDGVPRTLPALLEAQQLTRRAANVGFDWENVEGVLEKMREEMAELRQSLQEKKPNAEDAETQRAQRRVEEEVGDLLFVGVNVARVLGADPEIALKKANRKFAARFRAMERNAAREGKRLAEMKAEEMEELWREVKKKVVSG